MPALLERPKLSNTMARALHRHVMMERERKRQGSPGGHSRATSLMSDRAKQMFGAPVIAGRHYSSQTSFSPTAAEHGQYQSSQSSHGPYTVSQSQHSFAAGQAGPVNYAGSQPIRGPSAFQTMQYLSHQQPGYSMHSHYTGPHAGFMPTSTGIPLQKQLEHANQQSGFSDSSTLRPMHPQALQTLLPAPQITVPLQPAKSALSYSHPSRSASPGGYPHGTPPQQPHTSGFQASPQQNPRLPFMQHGQNQRFYHK
ncbi:hypothetical protein XELAEV_18001086mg [Xenopus laevis]|nr:hypothetical protein XELAEV_18001086mg [Xenopus laevis]